VPLHAWTSARYAIPLPAGHRFPIAKYRRLRERVVAEGLVRREAVHEPARARRGDLLAAHDAGWVDAFTRGDVDGAAMRRIGFPWSPALVERAWRAVGGTCEAAEAALELGVAINLAGGTHHAFRDR
jgi:acetoin utilization deacetylase AcuC-like enzyme